MMVRYKGVKVNGEEGWVEPVVYERIERYQRPRWKVGERVGKLWVEGVRADRVDGVDTYIYTMTNKKIKKRK